MLPLLIYKVINGMTPSYLNQLFNYVNNIHSVCVRPGIQSKDQNNLFYIQSEDILIKRGQNFSPRFVTRCTILTLP